MTKILAMKAFHGPSDIGSEKSWKTLTPPILLNKQYAEPTVFTAENMLRGARR